MIGQTTNLANNPPKDGAIFSPTVEAEEHELTEQELADMTPMRLAERIQQMEEAFKLLGPVEDVLNRIKCLEKWLFAGKDVLTLDEASVFLDASKSQLYTYLCHSPLQAKRQDYLFQQGRTGGMDQEASSEDKGSV